MSQKASYSGKSKTVMAIHCLKFIPVLNKNIYIYFLFMHGGHGGLVVSTLASHLQG